jgi:hypothetical protein
MYLYILNTNDPYAWKDVEIFLLLIYDTAIVSVSLYRLKKWQKFLPIWSYKLFKIKPEQVYPSANVNDFDTSVTNDIPQYTVTFSYKDYK